MDLKICNDSQEVAREVDQWLAAKTRNFVRRKVFIPAGNTPKALYELWRRTSPGYLKGLELFQVDDVVSGPQAGLFRRFLSDELEPWKNQIHWMDSGSEQAELAILGLGLNGHVAFHEPGLPADFFSGCVQLSPQTTERLNLERDTWGATYGVGAFRRCQAIALMVTGQEKRTILRRLIDGTGLFPAMALARHSNVLIIADRAAAP